MECGDSFEQAPMFSVRVDHLEYLNVYPIVFVLKLLDLILYLLLGLNSPIFDLRIVVFLFLEL